LALIHYKTIFRVDYKPSLDFYDEMHSIASKLTGYPNWQTTGLFVNLRDIEAWTSFHLAHNCFIFARDMKKEGRKGTDDERINEALEVVVPALGKPKYERIGMRCWFLQPVEMGFPELVLLTAERFLAQTKEIREGICPMPTDLAYNVHFHEGDLEVKLRVGPVRRDELEIQSLLDRNNLPPTKQAIPIGELLSDYPDVGLLIDIDISQANLKPDELKPSYLKANEIHVKLSRNIVKYVFGVTKDTKE
jgi:hypothetical protein